jgi:hypothetical protein
MNQYSVKPSLTGQKFGKWTVTGEVRRAPKPNGGTVVVYSCTCECGTVQDVHRGRLEDGTSTQCLKCRSLKQFCVRGHDTHTCGRNIRGVCRLCVKAANLESAYGITFEEYEALYNFQDGKCAICGKALAFTKVPDLEHRQGRAEVDHKHFLKKDAKKINKKGTVRGILCGGRWAGCNAKLGHVDKLEWLRAAVAYIANPPAQQLFKKAGNDNK